MKMCLACCLAFLAPFGLSGCNAERETQEEIDKRLRRMIVGKWHRHTDEVSGQIVLREDGTFTASLQGKGFKGLVVGLFDAGEFEGIWYISDGQLTKKPERMSNEATHAMFKFFDGVTESDEMWKPVTKPVSFHKGQLIWGTARFTRLD